MSFNSPFSDNTENTENTVTENTESVQVVVVADYFASELTGGAELSTQALIESSPFVTKLLKSEVVDLKTLETYQHAHWVFTNIAGMNWELIPTIVANMKYSVVEYDYKFCKWRSPEKHEALGGEKCDCKNEMQGKIFSAFLYGAKTLWWMSEKQQNTYHEMFPFLQERENIILSSIFDDNSFALINTLNEKYKDHVREGWIVLGSESWVKGEDAATKWCEDNNKKYEVVSGLTHPQLLEKLAQSEGHVYLPPGGDTCPRMVIEAKLLGCQLELNDNVEHCHEIWFETDDSFDTEAYLYAARERFWKGIKHAMEWRPSISGYTTTLNCMKHSYPYRQCIESMLGFCDEVVIVDGGSEDGTLEDLREWSREDPRVNVYTISRDWTEKRFAVYDGLQKAEARKRCKSDFCWQQDADEIVHEEDYSKILALSLNFPGQVDIVSLPVIEYWGGPEKVRMDVNPWKWRLSRNMPHITHGIPAGLRQTDEAGNMYAMPGTDGCDYIHNETGEVLAHASFYAQDAHNARMAALQGNLEAVTAYKQWFQNVVDLMPSVHHYSWFDLPRKIKTYRDYWSQHWQSLYNIEQEDTAENNMFFEKSWTDVTDTDVEQLALKLENELGGWVFHNKVDFTREVPHMTLRAGQPEIMMSRPVQASKIVSELDRLVKRKSDDNWGELRTSDNYDRVVKTYSFGDRITYIKKNEKDYVDLQASRGINIQSREEEESFTSKVKNNLEPNEADLVRIDELASVLNDEKLSGYVELGFRIPRLLDYFSKNHNCSSWGYDVVPLNVEVAKTLGYDARIYDLNKCEGNLDLSGASLISAYHVIEHVSNPLNALLKINESMDKGSVLHVEIPIEPGEPRVEFGHLFPFEEGDLNTMLLEAGFNVVSFSTSTHAGGPKIERCVARKEV